MSRERSRGSRAPGAGLHARMDQKRAAASHRGQLARQMSEAVAKRAAAAPPVRIRRTSDAYIRALRGLQLHRAGSQEQLLAASPIRDLLHRRLQPFRHLHDCSGCFRLEHSPGGTCTHWKAPPLHGAHVKRTLRIEAVDVEVGGKPQFKCDFRLYNYIVQALELCRRG